MSLRTRAPSAVSLASRTWLLRAHSCLPTYLWKHSFEKHYVRPLNNGYIFQDSSSVRHGTPPAKIIGTVLGTMSFIRYRARTGTILGGVVYRILEDQSASWRLRICYVLNDWLIILNASSFQVWTRIQTTQMKVIRFLPTQTDMAIVNPNWKLSNAINELLRISVTTVSTPVLRPVFIVVEVSVVIDFLTTLIFVSSFFFCLIDDDLCGRRDDCLLFNHCLYYRCGFHLSLCSHLNGRGQAWRWCCWYDFNPTLLLLIWRSCFFTIPDHKLVSWDITIHVTNTTPNNCLLVYCSWRGNSIAPSTANGLLWKYETGSVAHSRAKAISVKLGSPASERGNKELSQTKRLL